MYRGEEPLGRRGKRANGVNMGREGVCVCQKGGQNIPFKGHTDNKMRMMVVQ